jgi:DNA-binding MarR family transcriptional regulator
MSLDAEHFRALAGYRLAMRRFMAAAEGISKGAGLTQQHYQVLLAIRAWPGETMTIGDLAGELLLTHHATVQLLNRMQKAGLVARTPSSTDRRQVLLQLTDDGETVLQQVAVLHMREILRQEGQITRSLRRLRRLASGPDALEP